MILPSDIFPKSRLAMELDMEFLKVGQKLNLVGKPEGKVEKAVRGIRNTAGKAVDSVSGAVDGVGDSFRMAKNVDLSYAVLQTLTTAADKAELDHFRQKYDSLSEEEREELENDEDKFEQFVRDTNAELGIYEEEDEEEEDEDEEEEEEDDEEDDDDEDEDIEDIEDEDDEDEEDEDESNEWSIVREEGVSGNPGRTFREVMNSMIERLQRT